MHSARSQPNGTGRLFKYDVSVPLQAVPAFIDEVRSKIIGAGIEVCGWAAEAPSVVSSSFDGFEIDICCFGHAGDQNLHLNCLLRTLGRAANYAVIEKHNAIKVCCVYYY